MKNIFKNLKAVEEDYKLASEDYTPKEYLDRLEIIYDAINQIAKAHGKPKPNYFGKGKWNFDTEIKIWKKQIIGHEREHGYPPLTPLQWKLINHYISVKRRELKIK